MKKGGFSLVEVVLSMSLFAMVIAVTSAVLSYSGRISRNVVGADQAGRGLRKAEVSLQRDLLPASTQTMSVTPVPASLGGGGLDGDALCVLSALDPNGEPQRRADGGPFWQRNIIYHLVVPIGDTCSGGVGPGGYDDRCPHKVLIRQVVDVPPATVPTDQTTQEDLLPSMAGYLGRPTGLSVAGVGGPDTQSAKIVATNLLWFRATISGAELELDLRAISEVEARRSVNVGVTPLATSKFTTQHLISVYPRSSP